MTATYSPGGLVSARGRDWIVLAGSDAEVLRVRPVSGSEEDQTLLHVALELDPVKDARFSTPRADQRAGHDAGLLLRDALLLSLRRGAGPFRGFGQISVEPRAYQLVPLLLALKQDPVRLLVADDVGVGKTIEAALIARELYDRGEIDRATVLCPPHLVDQWVTELEERFHLHAVAVTASSAARLERDLPPSESAISAHPFTVVSLDYIKSDKRRADFLRACPGFVIVDEAHTCAASGPGRHQRYDLLKALAADPNRHLVLLTATPHSGDEEAFHRLIGLLDPAFGALGSVSDKERENLRKRLAGHLVQRRRPDIAEWKDGELFPTRETKEITYTLTGAWETFFQSVLDYCADRVAEGEGDATRQRLAFWGTLALLRCAASSPVAAVLALRTRAGHQTTGDEREELIDRLFDGSEDALPDDDLEPAAGTDDPALAALIEKAERLAGQKDDPKLKAVSDHVGKLLDDGFSPVVFCRYIATAHYLGRHLRGRFKDVAVSVVTGELTSEERRARIDELGDADGPRLLVATDCLSEGINLQEAFNAVVHYDLSWNPTRHEQREGRVDRFGQKKNVVRTTLLYGVNNPVDGAVLDVILRKAATIRTALGVPVPVPVDGEKLTEALLRAVLLRRGQVERSEPTVQLPLFERGWEDTRKKLAASRTLFAQGRLKPEDVLPEWRRTLAAIGDRSDVRRFADRALARLGSGLEAQKRGFKVPLAALPDDVRDRLDAHGLADTLRIDFDYPPAPGCRTVQRSHPLVSVLAETLLERTLSSDDTPDNTDPAVLGRVGCWVSNDVSARTVVVLLRLRHQLDRQRGQRTTTLLVEEATALAWSGAAGTPDRTGPDALALLAPPPAGDPPPHVRDRAVTAALELLATRADALQVFATERAAALLDDHNRVRSAAKDGSGAVDVRALLPVDVIGLFVLLPPVSVA